MRHALAADNRPALARVLSMPCLCAFDFDGTLAPFVADPDRAAMRASTRELFVELASARLCAVVSGRARDDVSARLDNARLLEVIGNHGIEPYAMDSAFAVTMRATRDVLAAALDAVAGVHIEDKGYTLAIHYRHAPDRVEARAAINAAVQRVRGVRALGGELVVNVVPRGAPHKGDALMALATRAGVASAVYVGDDETDEDVFEMAGATGAPSPRAPVELFTVRVGYSNNTRAQYFLEHQDEVDLFLTALIQESALIRETTT
jgi:trehalose 6-phosphate phosphatase